MKATISILSKTGFSLRQVLCENNSHLTGVGKILVNHYPTWDKVNELIMYGDIWELGENLLLTQFEHRDFERPYRRDFIKACDWAPAKYPANMHYRFRETEWLVYQIQTGMWLPIVSKYRQELLLFPQNEIKL